MRFCPFCSAENADELAVCQSCGRRLPPLPPRRARNAPGTGVQLPPRLSPTNPPPLPARRGGTTNPPSIAAPPGPPASPGPPAQAGQPGPLAQAGPLAQPSQPSVMVTVAGFAAAPSPSGLRAPAAQAAPMPPGPPTRDTAPSLPPPPEVDEGARALANALSPGPAAQRREALSPEAPEPGQSARRRSDPQAPPPGPPPRPMPSPPPSGPRPMPPGLTAPVSPPVPGGPGPGPATPATAPGNPLPTPQAAPDPPWATGYPRAPAGFGRDIAPEPPAASIAADAAGQRLSGDDGIDPPPTRIQRPEALVDRPFTPPTVSPIPEIPEPGLVNSARYTVRFAKARWQRRGAIKTLGADIKKDTDALDQVLGALGGVARTAMVDGRVFSGENAAITAAEQRAAQMTKEHNDVDARKLEENSRFADIERERNAKLAEAERMVDEAQKELAQLEAQRRGLRDKRKELERRQKAYLKAAEDGDRQTGNHGIGDARQELRRAAEQHRRDAAALEPERQEIDRRVAALERPISEVTAKLDAAKAELDAAKRSLSDAREGHTHRLAELDAEQKRKAREITQAEAEIARRLVTLGTLVNLNRIEDPQFAELYQRIDRLRGAITARTTEIEKLSAEREAYDRGNLVRGLAAIGGAILVFIALIVILRALLR